MIARPATRGDAPAISRIHAACFERGWDAHVMLGHIDHDCVWVIGADIVGFVILSCTMDEAEILTIALLPDHRGRGLAGPLLAAGMAAVTQLGARRLFLEVARDNEAALRLYARNGFAQIGLRKAYYPRAGQAGVDALTMARDLVG